MSAGDYADAQFLIRSIRSFEESRLLQYDADSFDELAEVVAQDPQYFTQNIPLKNHLRGKYRQMVESNLNPGEDGFSLWNKTM